MRSKALTHEASQTSSCWGAMIQLLSVPQLAICWLDVEAEQMQLCGPVAIANPCQRLELFAGVMQCHLHAAREVAHADWHQGAGIIRIIQAVHVEQWHWWHVARALKLQLAICIDLIGQPAHNAYVVSWT